REAFLRAAAHARAAARRNASRSRLSPLQAWRAFQPSTPFPCPSDYVLGAEDVAQGLLTVGPVADDEEALDQGVLHRQGPQVRPRRLRHVVPGDEPDQRDL